MTLRTVSEAAEELRCSTSLVYRLVAEGKLPAVHVGAKILLPVEAIERFLTTQLEESGDVS